jgi:hypothetical protein
MGKRDPEVSLNSVGQPMDILSHEGLIQTELSAKFLADLGRNSRGKIEGSRVPRG